MDVGYTPQQSRSTAQSERDVMNERDNNNSRSVRVTPHLPIKQI